MGGEQFRRGGQKDALLEDRSLGPGPQQGKTKATRHGISRVALHIDGSGSSFFSSCLLNLHYKYEPNF
jgi:hypothetical protein